MTTSTNWNLIGRILENSRLIVSFVSSGAISAAHFSAHSTAHMRHPEHAYGSKTSMCPAFGSFAGASAGVAVTTFSTSLVTGTSLVTSLVTSFTPSGGGVGAHAARAWAAPRDRPMSAALRRKSRRLSLP